MRIHLKILIALVRLKNRKQAWLKWQKNYKRNDRKKNILSNHD